MLSLVTLMMADEKVRVYPEEWRVPIPFGVFRSELKTRDIELEYRILRFLTENKKMVHRLHQGQHSKDRYRDILPFSENRVHLTPFPDYVNASWMPNFDGSNPKAFIACQGPLTSTLGDHWDMILENNVKAVFAIGSVAEGKTEKFAVYWPSDTNTPLRVHSERRGEIIVSLVRENHVSTHVIMRELLVLGRTIYHFHHTYWPDHSAMEEEHLLELVGRMRFWRTQEAPVVVHCSAGVGRTGCALTLCNVIEDIETQLREGGEGGISILEHAIHLRRYRLYMMQTTSQYVSVYRTVGYLLERRGHKDVGNEYDDTGGRY